MIQTKQVANKFLSVWFVAIFICCPLLMFPQGKQKQKELENKKSKLKQEINTINEMLHETKKNTRKSMGEVAILNTKISIRQELIATISTEIKHINSQIGTSQKEIDALKANLEKLKQEYARMIYYGYRNKDAYNKLMFMFAAGDFNQAYQRLKYIQQYNEYRKKQAAAIVSTQTEITQKINELEQKKEEKKMLLSGEEQEKLNLAKEKTEQEGMLAQLQDKEKQLKQELDQKKKDSEALTAAIKKLIKEEIERQAKAKADAIAKADSKKKREEQAKKAREEKNKNKNNVVKNNKEDVTVAEEKTSAPLVLELTKEAEDLSADFASNKGKLPWPVLKGVITDRFGTHEHATIKGFEVNNNGVDISTTQSSACRALFAGEVTGVVSLPNQGKVVIIRHGEYLSVYTNLENVNVKQGDKITIKQGIGNVAFNEDENRTVMNLQIWKGQKILNPEDWLYK